MSAKPPRQRVRALLPDLHLGFHPPGRLNSITDVPGVLVHTTTLHGPPDPARPASVINTGLTVILPRRDWLDSACYAATHTFNGAGELTGAHWIRETGLLASPIVLTGSFSVGAAHEGVYRHAIRERAGEDGIADVAILPVVGETYDGFLNDGAAMAVRPEMVVAAIDAASADAVPEGNTGGGTGMITMGFKAGTGSASRVVRGIERGVRRDFVVGALVQSNFGKMDDLHFGSVPVGRVLAREAGEEERRRRSSGNEGRITDGSIIAVLATDAPLHPTQLRRLAKRATVGLARAGGFGANFSGDIFLAFSTAAAVPADTPVPEDMTPAQAKFVARVDQSVDVVQDATINGLFEAAAEAVHESILNALCMAEDTLGPRGNRMGAIDLDQVTRIVERYFSGV
ncbi:hypothetical protein RB595_008680 [Gaeumannomyces hyphopodioides]